MNTHTKNKDIIITTIRTAHIVVPKEIDSLLFDSEVGYYADGDFSSIHGGMTVQKKNLVTYLDDADERNPLVEKFVRKLLALDLGVDDYCFTDK